MAALAVDLAVILTLGLAAGRLLAPLAAFGADVAEALGVVLYFAISLVYGALAEWLWRGQTVGKRLFGLRVVDARGLRLEPSQVVVRNLMRFIDGRPGLYLVGGVACVLHPHRQRLGDVAAGTVVVRERRAAPPDLDALLEGKFNSLAELRHLAARLRQKVKPQVAAVALEALLRRGSMEPGSRLALFAELAGHFRELVPYPAEAVEQLSDEQYVRDVVEVCYKRVA
jgi:uncharacterized RDD family membrane protein YckC